MPDISFESFNPRSFEQFGQALALRVFGPGVFIFGDGPDGGREATFDGKVDYPSPAQQWRGKIVIQCKFKQIPSRDDRDRAWLVAQLNSEIERLKSLGTPDYYIIITNVRLSSVRSANKKGGQEKLDKYLTSEFRSSGIRDVHVWHEQKLASFLDLYPELHRSYRAWISPREVLSSVLESFSDRIPDFGATVNRLLQRELREQRPTRLQQAGHNADTQTNLESVFVDLPHSAPAGEIEIRSRLFSAVRSSTKPEYGLLEDLLALSTLKLDSESLNASWSDNDGPRPVRHLILGGPGQGKSTISQFLAQILRAQILTAAPKHLLNPSTVPVIQAISESLRERGIVPGAPLRYPVRIDLPTYANELLNSQRAGMPLSVLRHLANKIASGANEPRVDEALMRRWLREYPWMLLLDGLDEVPPSSNRHTLLTAINEFWDEAAGVNADVFMVITTRPQGYNDDLDPTLYMRHEMVRLSTSQALAYAERLALQKLPEEDRRIRVMDRLRIASENATTATLMISPLQVAILLQLVDQRGTAPTDRWTLFSEYFSVVLKREQEKLGHTGTVVREKALVIDGLLRRAGLLLHLEAESQGGAESYLSTPRLENIARDLLLEDGHEGQDLERWVEEIINATTHRLVFLEQRTEGKIEFDVRSLQEFMAAAEIMSGEDLVISDRLYAIAGKSHWSHVYRISASKAFSVRDANKYRDAVVTATMHIDRDDLTRAVRYASSAALDLIMDGVASDQPRYFKALLRQATQLFELGPHQLDRRFFDIFANTKNPVIADQLRELSNHPSRECRTSTWRLMLGLIETCNDDMDRLATALWPGNIDDRLAISTIGIFPSSDSYTFRLLEESLLDAAPASIQSGLQNSLRQGAAIRVPDHVPNLSFLQSLSTGHPKKDKGIILKDMSSPLSLQILTLDRARSDGMFDFPVTRGAKILQPLVSFVKDSTLENLHCLLVSWKNEVALKSIPRNLPWLLSTLLELIKSGRDPMHLADEALGGSFGTPSGWSEAERRWLGKGMTDSDFRVFRDGIFFDGRVGEVGVPGGCPIWMTLGPPVGNNRWLTSLLDALLNTTEGPQADLLRSILLFSLSRYQLPTQMEINEFLHLISGNGEIDVSPNILKNVSESTLLELSVASRLDQIGCSNGFTADGDEVNLPVSLLASLAAISRGGGILQLGIAAYGGVPNSLLEFAKSVKSLCYDTLVTKPENESAIFLLYVLNEIDVDSVTKIFRRRASPDALSVAAFNLARMEDVNNIVSNPERLLSTLLDQFGDSATAAVRRILDGKQSELRNATSWKALKFPETLFAMLSP